VLRRAARTYPGGIAPSTYTEFEPTSAARAHIACTWVGVVGAQSGVAAPERAGYTDRVLPDGCIDMIWDGTTLFVAGPDTHAVELDSPPAAGSFHVGVRFRPGRASPFLGVPAVELRDQRVDAGALMGEAVATRWREELGSLTPVAAASTLEQRIAALAPPFDDDLVARADAVLRRARHERVSELAGTLGLSERSLHRVCVDGFGYGPKMLQRVLRFREFLALAERRPDATVAALAAEAGYHDQSHCNRDCLRLSGLAPSALLANRGVRSVQDAAA